MRSFVKSWTFVGGLFLHMSTPLYISLWQESQSSPMLRDSFTSHLCSIPTTKSSWIKFPWSRCYWSAFSYVVTIVILFARHKMLFTFDFHQKFSIKWPPPTTKPSWVRFSCSRCYWSVLFLTLFNLVTSVILFTHHQMFSTKCFPPKVLHQEFFTFVFHQKLFNYGLHQLFSGHYQILSGVHGASTLGIKALRVI